LHPKKYNPIVWLVILDAISLYYLGYGLEAVAEQTKKYFYIRQKVLNLQRVWRKYIEVAKLEGS